MQRKVWTTLLIILSIFHRLSLIEAFGTFAKQIFPAEPTYRSYLFWMRPLRNSMETYIEKVKNEM